jgi:hypothetical protein
MKRFKISNGLIHQLKKRNRLIKFVERHHGYKLHWYQKVMLKYLYGNKHLSMLMPYKLGRNI